MKYQATKSLLLNSLFIFATTQLSYADFSEHGHKSEQNETNQVLIISNNKISPQIVNVSPPGGGVFILNKSSMPLMLEIDFGEKKAHCASREVEMSKTGVMKTKETLKPNEFISVCFPDKGTHSVKAGNKLNAKINVL